MPATPLAAYPYPSANDAPAAAADLMALALAIDSKATLTAVDAADRDARYSTAVTGTLVVSGAAQSMWLKTGPGNDWMAVYEDTGEVTKGFSAATDWTIGSFCFARRINHVVEICAELMWSGNDIVANDHTSPTPGNIPDKDVLYIPPAFSDLVGSKYRTFIFSTPWTSGSGHLYGSGRCVIRDMHPGSAISSGNFVRFSLTFTN